MQLFLSMSNQYRHTACIKFKCYNVFGKTMVLYEKSTEIYSPVKSPRYVDIINLNLLQRLYSLASETYEPDSFCHEYQNNKWYHNSQLGKDSTGYNIDKLITWYQHTKPQLRFGIQAF